jgi:hypothetical protein
LHQGQKQRIEGLKVLRGRLFQEKLARDRIEESKGDRGDA